MTAIELRMNALLLKVLGPTFVLIGLAVQYYPLNADLLSKSLVSNMFYIDAGLIACIVLFTNNIKLMRVFNYLFGLTLICLVAATWFTLFPADYFKYTMGNKLLNTNIGMILIFTSVFWDSKK